MGRLSDSCFFDLLFIGAMQSSLGSYKLPSWIGGVAAASADGVVEYLSLLTIHIPSEGPLNAVADVINILNYKIVFEPKNFDPRLIEKYFSFVVIGLGLLISMNFAI